MSLKRDVCLRLVLKLFLAHYKCGEKDGELWSCHVKHMTSKQPNFSLHHTNHIWVFPTRNLWVAQAYTWITHNTHHMFGTCPQTIGLYHHHKQSFQLISNNIFNDGGAVFKRLKEGLGDERKTQRVGDWDTLRISLLCCVLFEVPEWHLKKWSKMNLVVQMFVNIVWTRIRRNFENVFAPSIYSILINGPFQQLVALQKKLLPLSKTIIIWCTT